VLDARPEVILLALCGYSIDCAKRDYEILHSSPLFRSTMMMAPLADPVMNVVFARVVDANVVQITLLRRNIFTEWDRLDDLVDSQIDFHQLGPALEDFLHF
jgi:hypothetical protein